MTNRALDWLRSCARVVRLREAPLDARLRLLWLGIRVKLGPRRQRRWDFGPGAVELGAETLEIDWRVLAEIFLSRVYATRLDDAIVVDCGAHKGYFGAYALLGGAAAVLSLEPSSQNFAHLARAAASVDPGARRWVTRRAAVSSTDGDTELRIHGESWAHTVLPVGAVSEAPVGVERVESMSMGRVLELARELGNGRVVVKLDIEGAECDGVQGTAAEAWNSVYELFVEHHAFAPCTVDTLVRHLAGAALPLHDVRVGDVLHFKRARRDRSLSAHGGTR